MKNETFAAPSCQYYTQEKAFLYHLIPDGPNAILDLGCAAGRLGRKLLELKKASTVHGVEIFPEAAEEAAASYVKVHVGDIEEMELPYNQDFDVVICGDILEHLKEPRKVVARIRNWLKPGGHLICCVPNVRYWRVCRDLVCKGRWDYAGEGIMDATHLRFFTRQSLRKMLSEASFKVEYEGFNLAGGRKHELLNTVTMGALKDFLGYQIIMSARKP